MVLEEKSLFPQQIDLPEDVRNYHVIPIVYAGVNYGFLISGYRDALVPNKYMKRFCRCLALGCRVLFGAQQQIKSQLMMPLDSETSLSIGYSMVTMS